MKRNLFLLLSLLACIVASAQENRSFLIPAKIKQGSIMLGGDLSASAFKTTKGLDLPLSPEEGTNLLLNLNAKNAYFLRHDFAVGLVVSMEHESLIVATDEDTRKFRRTYLLAGPFTRYYLDSGLFGELALQTGLLNFSSGQKSNLFQGGLSVGYAYFVNERISLEPMVSFQYQREWRDGRSNTTLGPQIGFGVQAYILRRTSHIIKQAL